MSPSQIGSSWWHKPLATLATLGVIIGTGVGISQIPSTPPPPPTPSNIFVDTNGGTCIRYPAAHAYVDAEACGSMSAAYSVASVGDTVLMESGSYPAQTINATSKSSGACDGYTVGDPLTGCVTFQADNGATVTFSGQVSIQSSYVRLSGFPISSVDVGSSNPLTTITDVVLSSISGTNLQLHNIRNFGDLGGSWGPKFGTPVQIANQGGTNASLASHLRFDGTWFHDATEVTAFDHLECFQSQPGDYITIRNSKFTNCAQFDIEFGGGSLSTHFLVENNLLSRTCSNQSSPCGGISTIGLACTSGATFSDYTIRFNSISGYPMTLLNFGNGCSFGGTNRIYGNIFDTTVPLADCTNIQNAGFSWSYNVRPTGSALCSVTDSSSSNQWVSPNYPSYNFHLLNCSVLSKDFVPTSVTGGYPTTGYYGSSRPTGSALDAGAAEDC